MPQKQPLSKTKQKAHQLKSKNSDAAQPIKVETNKIIVNKNFIIGDIVWCKIKGFRPWPAKVAGFDKNNIFVHWFNDNRYSTVSLKQLYSFSEYCLNFSQNVSGALEKAIKEALIVMRKNL